MRWILLALALLPFGSCHQRDRVTALCDVARDPGKYVGRVIVIADTLTVDGHGTPDMIPDSSCNKLPWFTFTDNELSASTRQRYYRQVESLNAATVNGHRARLAGRYTVRVLGQKEPAIIQVALVDVRGLRLADARSKSQSLNKQMGPPPTNFR